MALLDDSVPTDRISQLSVQQSGPETQTFGAVLSGHHTDLVVTRFTDRTLIVVTQVKKLGTVLDICRDTVNQPGTDNTRPVYSVSVLLGQDSEGVVLFGRILAEKLKIAKPLLLCVGIREKNLSRDMTKQVVEFVASKF